MPVDTTHPDYDLRLPQWKKMRDTAAGEWAVKEAGEEYLPRLDGQSARSYQNYRDRAQFFGATGRTLQALEGFIFRKDPEVTFPDALEGFTMNATRRGLDWWGYQKVIVREVLEVGRAGTLIDWDPVAGQPYAVTYKAEDVINWKTSAVAGQMMLTLLVLQEESMEWMPLSTAETQKGEPDQYSHQCFRQWRCYRVVTDAGGLPFVEYSVWRLKQEDAPPSGVPMGTGNGAKREFVKLEQGLPSRRGIPLTRIPFVFHGPHNSLPDVDKVPLLDLAEANLSLYRTSADLEHGRHWTGLPTPWLAGFKDIKELTLGSTSGLVSDDPTAKCGFLEFTGNGLTALTDAVKEKQAQIAALGARMLEPEAQAAEATATVELRNSSENSALMNLTVSCSASLSRVLQWAAWWLGTQEEPEDVDDAAEVELNTEFVSATMSPDFLDKIRTAMEAGSLPVEAYVYQLRKGEILPPDMTDEDAIDAITKERQAAKDAAMGSGAGGFGQKDPPPGDPNADPSNNPPAPPAKK